MKISLRTFQRKHNNDNNKTFKICFLFEFIFWLWLFSSKGFSTFDNNKKALSLFKDKKIKIDFSRLKKLKLI